jgi:hypothetical protein
MRLPKFEFKDDVSLFIFTGISGENFVSLICLGKNEKDALARGEASYPSFQLIEQDGYSVTEVSISDGVAGIIDGAHELHIEDDELLLLLSEDKEYQTKIGKVDSALGERMDNFLHTGRYSAFDDNDLDVQTGLIIPHDESCATPDKKDTFDACDPEGLVLDVDLKDKKPVAELGDGSYLL